MHRKIYLFGSSVQYSFSPKIHNEEFRRRNVPILYEARSIKPENFHAEIQEYLRAPDFLGANVTIPFKEEVIQYLDEVSPEAQKIRAVNTILKKADGRLLGFNTDAQALFELMKADGVTAVESAFIFGMGGGARAAIYALAQLGCKKFTISSRSNKKLPIVSELVKSLGVRARYVELQRIVEFFEWAEQNKIFQKGEDISASFVGSDLWLQWRGQPSQERAKEEELKSFDILINATPVGFYPKVDEVLIDHPFFLKMFKLVLDMVYNPEITRLLFSARLAGARTISGLDMLYEQARLSRKIWLDELV